MGAEDLQLSEFMSSLSMDPFPRAHLEHGGVERRCRPSYAPRAFVIAMTMSEASSQRSRTSSASIVVSR